MPSQSSVTSSGPFIAMVSNLPLRFIRSAASVFKGSPAHVSTLSSPAARGLHPAGSPRRPPEAAATCRESRRLSATGIRFLDILSRRGIAPLLRSAYRTASVRTPTGFPRSTHTRHGRGERPLYPEASGVLTTGSHSPVAACRPYQRPGPITQVFVPSSRVRNKEASSGVHSRSPARPSPRPVAPPDGTGALRLLPWASHPHGQDPSTHARAGIDLEH
jgi:hypothetical protein